MPAILVRRAAQADFSKDLDEPSANFMYETLLAGDSRWDDLERHQLRRAERAGDHGKRVEALRLFALEWVQRFKDKERGAKFFNAAIAATASNGASQMRSIVAAFTLLRQVQGERGEWTQLLDLADAVMDRMASGEEKLFIAIQGGHIAFDKVNDLARAKKYFAIAASIEPQNPNVQDFVQAVGIDDVPMATGSMPSIRVDSVAAPEPEPEDEEPRGKKRRGRRDSEGTDMAAAARAAAEVEVDADEEREEREAAARAVAERAAAAEAADRAAAAAETAARAERAAADKAAAERAAADRLLPTRPPPRRPPPTRPLPTRPLLRQPPAAAMPADLKGAMEKARNAEGGGDKGVGEWKRSSPHSRPTARHGASSLASSARASRGRSSPTR
jgi:hypothetical protein